MSVFRGRVSYPASGRLVPLPLFNVFFSEMQAALVALIGTDVALVMYLVAVLSVHPGINVATRQETPYALQATTAVIT